MTWEAWRLQISIKKKKQVKSDVAFTMANDKAIRKAWHVWQSFCNLEALQHAKIIKACALLRYK
jgi:hypothetical protein